MLQMAVSAPFLLLFVLRKTLEVLRASTFCTHFFDIRTKQIPDTSGGNYWRRTASRKSTDDRSRKRRKSAYGSTANEKVRACNKLFLLVVYVMTVKIPSSSWRWLDGFWEQWFEF